MRMLKKTLHHFSFDLEYIVKYINEVKKHEDNISTSGRKRI